MGRYPNAGPLAKETYRVLKPGGIAFIVICDPAEGRFHVPGHIDRRKGGSDIQYWEKLFGKTGFTLLPSSLKYRRRDWRRIFNLPLLRYFKDKPDNEIKFSSKTGEVNQGELSLFKAEISGAMRHIKAYKGPSRTWFSYQDSLTEGCSCLASIFSKLPVSQQTTSLIIGTLIKLDKKLSTGGVDDSDGTVGGFMEEVVGVLEKFARLEPRCIKAFKKLVGKETCFGWEKALVRLLDKKNN